MLRALNQALIKRPVPGKFVCLLCATCNERDRSFTIANSGLPYPIWVRGEQVFQVQAAGLPLGMFEDAQYEEHTLHCTPGDVVVLFTDGITEAVDAYGNEFGRYRLEQLVRDHQQYGAEHILEVLLRAVKAHACDAEAFDDQTAIVINA
jgi:phosphoserine phosphatase RsbU/P